MELENTAFPFLAEPLPGEILSSVIARSAWLAGDSFRRFSRQVSATNPMDPFICSCLDSFTDFEAVLKRTVYPFYLSGFPEYRAEKVKAGLREGNPSLTRIQSKRLKPFKKTNLYYCPRCLEYHLEAYGVGYFRLEHQYEGVTACPEHSVELVELDSLPRPLFEEDIVPAAKASEYETAISKILADVAAIDFGKAGECYRNIAESLEGNSMSSRITKMRNIVNERNPLAKVPIDSVKLKSLMGMGGYPVHPYFHALIWNAFGLDSDSVGYPEKFKAEKESTVCRNPFCKSANIDRLGFCNGGNSFFRCRECGMVFSKTRILQLGEKGKTLLKEKEKKETGFIEKTMKSMGVGHITLKRLLSQDGDAEDHKISKMRKRAMTYHSRKELNENDKSLSYYLTSMDYDWFKKNFPKTPKFHPNKALLAKEMNEKDMKLLEELKKVREQAQNENVWISRNYLLKKAGCNGKSMAALEKSRPKSAEFVRENAETVEDSYIRRVKNYIDCHENPSEINVTEIKRNVAATDLAAKAFRLMESYRKEKVNET